MHASYSFWLVALSILVAVVVSYTALMLVGRVAQAERTGARAWLIGGALSMGIGIWSMHFIGMLAYSVAIALRYSILMTLASLLIGILTSGFALAMASRRDLSLRRLLLSSIVMGSGICGMHYTGMAAIPITPVIRYNSWLVVASIAIAISASFAALWLAFRLRGGRSRSMTLVRCAAAVVMGCAITGMHYTAMAALMLAPDSYCLGGANFDNNWLAVTIALISLALLAITLVTAIYDAHLKSSARRNALDLARVNADLQQGKHLLKLATQAAGIVCWEYELAGRRMLWTENDIESLQAAGIDLRSQPDAVLALVHADDAAAALASLGACLDGMRELCALRVRVVMPAGEMVYLQVHARLLRAPDGGLERVLGVCWDVTGEVRQERRGQELQAQLRQASHQAGMAEVATGVLHNVGNVLNSLGVSAALVQGHLRQSRMGNVRRVADLIGSHGQGQGLAAFLCEDARGREIPAYLARLSEHLDGEHQTLQREIQAILTHIEHIGRIVSAQQSHARRGGVAEELDLAELADSALAMHFTADAQIQVRRDYQVLPHVIVDRHRLLQILGNLLSNARHALWAKEQGERVLTLRVHAQADWLVVQVRDTGVGIDAAAFARLFEFGFTTRREGHGFGLHASANLAREMGGELQAHSDGPGQGACFTLRLPLAVAREGAARKYA